MSSLFADTYNMVAILEKSDAAEVKCSDDIIRLQALVDRKNIVILEDVIRKILQFDDAEGVVCLPNEDIFAGLAQMGYEKPSAKLTFYKAFFSSHWKFLSHTLLLLVHYNAVLTFICLDSVLGFKLTMQVAI
nr:hypothetical protein [Tanacetum cinerariifolium]